MCRLMCYWFIVFAVIDLLSCQSHLELGEERAIKNQKLHDAAVYNMQLGLAYLRQSERVRAKQKLLRALDLDPNAPDVNAAMGYFLEKTEDSDKANVFYKKALALAPSSGAQLNNYGTFLCRRGQYKEAESYFLKAVRDVHYIHTAEAYENAGLCATAIPDYRKAILYFKKALAEDPEKKQSLAEVAHIEMKLNRPDKALKLLLHYRQQVLNDKTLLVLAMNAAHQTGRQDVEDMLKVRLAHQVRFSNES